MKRRSAKSNMLLQTTVYACAWLLLSSCSDAPVSHTVLSRSAAPGATPTAALGANAMSLKTAGSLSAKLSLDDKDAVVALCRLSDAKLTAATRSGVGYEVDLASGKINRVEPFFVFDQSKLKIWTVSKDYMWELATDSGLIGRNKKAPDSQHQFEIAKAPAGDMLANLAAATPLAASEQQLFFLNPDSLVVLTWVDAGIKRQKVALTGGGLGSDESALGAGPVGDAADGNFWLLTSQRLMVYEKAWSSQPFTLPTSGAIPSLVSMVLSAGAAAPAAGSTIVGLSSGNTLGAFNTISGVSPAAGGG